MFYTRVLILFLKQVTTFGNGATRRLFCKSLVVGVLDGITYEKVLEGFQRDRREASYSPRGRYRGQTQSQYLAIDRGGGKDEGKAEAHSAADSSRATVGEYQCPVPLRYFLFESVILICPVISELNKNKINTIMSRPFQLETAAWDKPRVNQCMIQAARTVWVELT